MLYIVNQRDGIPFIQRDGTVTDAYKCSHRLTTYSVAFRALLLLLQYLCFYFIFIVVAVAIAFAVGERESERGGTKLRGVLIYIERLKINQHKMPENYDTVTFTVLFLVICFGCRCCFFVRMRHILQQI